MNAVCAAVLQHNSTRSVDAVVLQLSVFSAANECMQRPQTTKTAALLSNSRTNAFTHLPGIGDCRCIISCRVIFGEDDVKDED